MSNVTPVLAGLDATTAWQEKLYQQLHAHPELSFQETETSAEIVRRLESFGYEVQRIGGGVVGVLANGEGPTVLARADMDALPVKENTGLPYASQVTAVDDQGNTVPVMHACGHDVHVTAGLGAAELLSASKDRWSGTYIALFQPAEELAAGSRRMVDEGLVGAVPTPDVCLAQHVMPGVAGNVASRPGAVMSAADSIRITVYGKGSHGSMPHLGIDPVLLAASIVQSLQSIVARVLAPGDFGVVTVGSLQAGTKANIIPDNAVLRVNIRAYDTEVRDTILASIERIVRAECQAAGSPREPDFEYYDHYPLTHNSAEQTAKVMDAFRDHFGEDRVAVGEPVTASEDFSTIPEAFGAPYVYWFTGGFLPGMPVFPNHNPGFAPAMQPTLRTGTEAIVVAAMAYFGKETAEQ
ncbi:amidohydrolase [Raineyella fluvialis]|uniref:Amidohydrolase n=1 Tax=Raineyella fluvialis TaxID=2662261 RepID=A0A5Q2FHG8_9ACTN|nr:amidohydrolase [Raineyella fluvialis]QGF24994.1 amidohydrolase [Raineyella fluvialis]